LFVASLNVLQSQSSALIDLLWCRCNSVHCDLHGSTVTILICPHKEVGYCWSERQRPLQWLRVTWRLMWMDHWPLKKIKAAQVTYVCLF